METLSLWDRICFVPEVRNIRGELILLIVFHLKILFLVQASYGSPGGGGGGGGGGGDIFCKIPEVSKIRLWLFDMYIDMNIKGGGFNSGGGGGGFNSGGGGGLMPYRCLCSLPDH